MNTEYYQTLYYLSQQTQQGLRSLNCKSVCCIVNYTVSGQNTAFRRTKENALLRTLIVLSFTFTFHYSTLDLNI